MWIFACSMLALLLLASMLCSALVIGQALLESHYIRGDDDPQNEPLNPHVGDLIAARR